MPTDTPAPAAAPAAVPGGAPDYPPVPDSSTLSRLALPALLFSLTLAGLLIASQFLLLPRLTRVEVSGQVRQATELAGLRQSLQAQIHAQEQARDKLLVPIDDSSYAALKNFRSARVDPLLVQAQVIDQAQSLSTQPDSVHVSSFRVTPGEKTAELTGDIRFVGTRSITLLAQLVSLLGRLPLTASVTQPRYVRMDGPSGPHSPFTVSLQLR